MWPLALIMRVCYGISIVLLHQSINYCLRTTAVYFRLILNQNKMLWLQIDRGVLWTNRKTRMHSSRMRTIRSSPYGGSLSGRPQTETSQTKTTLDRDLPPGQRSPWTKIPQQWPHGHRPPWTLTPIEQRPPWKEHETRDWDHSEGTWDQAARQEVTSYRDPPVDRMTDTCLWKYYLTPNFICRR